MSKAQMLILYQSLRMALDNPESSCTAGFGAIMR